MAYIITEPCIGTKDTSCADVCPVDCIHPSAGEEGHDEATMLYIDPAECIDCDACVEACPVDATMSEDDVPDSWDVFKEINKVYFEDGPAAGEKMVASYLASKA
jgi:NAD-dependent dihydropyrimidine dehydrogenase PreA subunit